MSALPRIEAPWLVAPGPKAVIAAIEAAGRKAYFVGGCVRNALLGREATDIDLATDARPDEVIALAEAAGLRAVPTGIAHGTVTVVAEATPVEVTTFRRDVATDGRRAVVAFADDIAEDAARRDLTMNAVYATGDGVILDPLGGLDDLLAGRVRFVGDPADRIREDYLRILRFFRFHAWYGAPGRPLDRAGLLACAAAVEGIARLSRERVGAELVKLLAAPDPAAAVAAMAGIGALSRILADADPAPLAPLVRLERAGGYPASARRRLAALGATPAWPGRLRIARADARALEAIRKALAAGAPPAASAYRHGAEAARDAALVLAAREGAAPPADLEAQIARGAAAVLPLRAADLHLEGPAVGAALRRAEAAWIASDFSLDRAALLAAAGAPEA